MKYFGYLKKEQLTNQPQLKDEFLSKFEEGAITFPPTYKIGNPMSKQGSTAMSTIEKGYPDGLIVSSIEKIPE